MDHEPSDPPTATVLVIIMGLVLLGAIVGTLLYSRDNPSRFTDHERLATQIAELRSDVQALSTTVADMAGALR